MCEKYAVEENSRRTSSVIYVNELDREAPSACDFQKRCFHHARTYDMCDVKRTIYYTTNR